MRPSLPADATLAQRLWQYVGERFPLPAYLPMILLAAAAGTGYSRAARAEGGFVAAPAYFVAALTLLAIFFALRVADEHKDARLDRAVRPELPVPRGLVSLGELRIAAVALSIAAAIANLLLAPPLIVPLAGAALWLALMTREFMVGAWLRRRPALYLLSHMIIMPVVMFYATSVDWLAAGAPLPRGLGLFLAASFVTGVVLEVGRKVRSSTDERSGVETYTAAWGRPRALGVWLLSLAASSGTVALAGAMVDAWWSAGAAVTLGLLSAGAAPVFARRSTAPNGGKVIELASAAWTLAAYGSLALTCMERSVS